MPDQEDEDEVADERVKHPARVAGLSLVDVLLWWGVFFFFRVLPFWALGKFTEDVG